MTAAAVLDRFRQGDADAVRELYAVHGRSVFAVAFRSLGDRGLAEEVVQQTFVQAWRASSTVDPDRDDLGPWLRTIARRLAIDVYRRERRRAHDALDEQRELESSVAADEGDRAWSGLQVRLAVDGLPTDEREVVKMQHFLSMTHPEIAEHLSIPLGTVKSRSHRAHQRLASSLGFLKEVVG